MKGIRKRVLVSFLSVVVLLFFAGLVSLFELRRVSSDTEEILRASERNLGLAKDMLDAAARQNKAVVHSIVFRQRDYDTVLMGSIAEMARTLEVVRREAVEQAYLDTLSASAMNVQRLTSGPLSTGFVVSGWGRWTVRTTLRGRSCAITAKRSVCNF